MGPRCTMLVLIFLTFAVPFTALLWGGFWLWRQHWSAILMDAGDRRVVWITLGWCALILVEMSVLVCVAADHPRP
jgi:hypothetical protein